ncbi:5-(carboxyamino)imidazole ribonucleotide synthase [Thermaurantiacus tibetensis]|uniref:5-(carboxyamino)imidazole ribonucleotide synthase n=1 Tax=Thermaurantiacus tibetensis TaxID=2759035 RepID=UPI00188E3D7A|nr:5-(carboxyamino)imidazole ribonucleotide synthase [Thermaurantiacus tibetensis]
MIPPGRTIGILGGGQLGRMLAIAAAQMGYRTHIFAPDAEQPAAEVATEATTASYADEAALRRFAGAVDVVTCEFENVPAQALELLETLVPVRPGARAFAVAQDRLLEKRFVEGLGGTPARYAPVDDEASLAAALARLGVPAILKTRRLGYDGKGQERIDCPDDAERALTALGRRELVLEEVVPFRSEFSIILARGIDGGEAHYVPIANRHEGGILAESRAPAPDLSPALVAEATGLVVRVADALGYVGVLACEFFATDGGAVFNEMAPRVHNSGHWTIEGAETCQFEQHIRAIAGLPLGSPRMLASVAIMHNLLGDAASDAHRHLCDPHAHLHLYGKRAALPGRKMGHVTILPA